MPNRIHLYEIPKYSKIFIKPPLEVADGSSFIVFHHIDGMYSYCVSENGGAINLSAKTPLVEVLGGYEIIP